MTPRHAFPILIALVAMTGCASPTYVNTGEGESGGISFNQVVFQVHDAYKAAPPDCVAILPLKVKTPTKPEATPEELGKIRESLYAHLATQSKRSIRLERIDRTLVEVREDRKALGERLKCVAVIEGEVTEYGSDFYGIYSRVAVGIELKMVRTADGLLLWEGRHVASSHGGTIPLDPVGVAMGVVDAASNVRDEQILRVTDDLARRLVSTIPDDKIVALDDPAEEPTKATKQIFPVDDVAEAERLLAASDHSAALASADRAIESNPNGSDAWFVKGRILMMDRNFPAAEPAILKAVSLQDGNAKFLNALGAVNAENGNNDRALAAYRMAINAEPTDGFAWYNSAVIYFNAGNPTEAADAFYGAGLAYLKTGDNAKAERVLGDLRDLEKAGIPIQTRIQSIEGALSDTTRRKI